MSLRDGTESLLALVVVGGLVFIAIYANLRGQPVAIPVELYGFGGIVMGAFFRGAAGNAIRALTSPRDAQPGPLPPSTKP